MKCRKLLLPLILGVLALSTQSSAALFGGLTQCINGYAYADGCPGAPTATIQHPTLLVSYSYPPPWNVAGVNYAVGYPTGTSLQDPTTYAWSAPLSYSSSLHAVRCDSGSNATINGFDFSLHNGIGIYNASCTNLTVENSNFVVGSNCVEPISHAGGSSGITILDNVFDGGGPTSGCGTSVGETISINGSGPVVIEYNWFKNVFQHYVSFGTGGGSATLKYNVIERCGFYQGNHCNGEQFVGGTWTSPVISFNTVVSPQPDTDFGITPTAVFTSGSNSVTSGSAYGLVPNGSSASSLKAGMSITSADLPGGTTISGESDSGGPAPSPPVITTITTSQNATASSTASFDVPNAYPAGLDEPIQIQAQSSGTLTNATVSNNTIITTSPIKTVSTVIFCNAQAGSTNTTPTISANYMDISGVLSGTFYTGTGYCSTSSATFSGNINMNTGATIAGPP